MTSRRYDDASTIGSTGGTAAEAVVTRSCTPASGRSAWDGCAPSSITADTVIADATRRVRCSIGRTFLGRLGLAGYGRSPLQQRVGFVANATPGASSGGEPARSPLGGNSGDALCGGWAPSSVESGR